MFQALLGEAVSRWRAAVVNKSREATDAENTAKQMDGVAVMEHTPHADRTDGGDPDAYDFDAARRARMASENEKRRQTLDPYGRMGYSGPLSIGMELARPYRATAEKLRAEVLWLSERLAAAESGIVLHDPTIPADPAEQRLLDAAIRVGALVCKQTERPAAGVNRFA